MRLHGKQARLYVQVSLMILVLGLGLMAGMGLESFGEPEHPTRTPHPIFD